MRGLVVASIALAGASAWDYPHGKECFTPEDIGNDWGLTQKDGSAIKTCSDLLNVKGFENFPTSQCANDWCSKDDAGCEEIPATISNEHLIICCKPCDHTTTPKPSSTTTTKTGTTTQSWTTTKTGTTTQSWTTTKPDTTTQQWTTKPDTTTQSWTTTKPDTTTQQWTTKPDTTTQSWTTTKPDTTTQQWTTKPYTTTYPAWTFPDKNWTLPDKNWTLPEKNWTVPGLEWKSKDLCVKLEHTGESKGCIEHASCASFWGDHGCVCDEGYFGDGYTFCKPATDITIGKNVTFDKNITDVTDEFLLKKKQFGAFFAPDLNLKKNLTEEYFGMFGKDLSFDKTFPEEYFKYFGKNLTFDKDIAAELLGKKEEFGDLFGSDLALKKNFTEEYFKYFDIETIKSAMEGKMDIIPSFGSLLALNKLAAMNKTADAMTGWIPSELLEKDMTSKLALKDMPEEMKSMMMNGTMPTGFPTGMPTGFPTGMPSDFPTGFPTDFPDMMPTGMPDMSFMNMSFMKGDDSMLPTADDLSDMFGAKPLEVTPIASFSPESMNNEDIQKAFLSANTSKMVTLDLDQFPTFASMMKNNNFDFTDMENMPTMPANMPTMPATMPTMPVDMFTMPTAMPIVPTSMPTVPSSNPIMKLAGLGSIPSVVPSDLSHMIPTGMPSLIPSGMPTMPSMDSLTDVLTGNKTGLTDVLSGNKIASMLTGGSSSD